MPRSRCSCLLPPRPTAVSCPPLSVNPGSLGDGDHGNLGALKNFGVDPTGFFPDNLELSALSLRWTALQPSTIARSVLMLDRARNFEEFREALRYWDVPPHNVVYADVDGNIGYQTPGLMPIRLKGDDFPGPGRQRHRQSTQTWPHLHDTLRIEPFSRLDYLLGKQVIYQEVLAQRLARPEIEMPPQPVCTGAKRHLADLFGCLSFCFHR